MNKRLVIFVFLLTISLNSLACTEEEFKSLDTETSNEAKVLLNEKKKTLEEYMNKIKAKKGLTPEELYSYRKAMLNHPKAKKLSDKDKVYAFSEVLEISKAHDCEYLKKQFSKSLESTNNQWNIVFEAIEKDLNTMP